MANDVIKKLPNFQQSTIRAWIWLAMVAAHTLMGIFVLFYGAIGLAVQNLILAAGIFWIDQLEKELTRRNLADQNE